MSQVVVVAGATGMLGGRIAHHLCGRADARVRLLVRPGTEPSRVAALVERGAGVVTADLTDVVALARALDGADVVVSALQGGPDVIEAGQLALFEAARRCGVRRILPSDFALDLFEAPVGENANFDMRRRADDAIAMGGLEHVHVLCGAFMDNFLRSQFGQILDWERGVASYWGSGDDAFDATSVEDTAIYTAHAALDRLLPSGKFAIAGQQLTFNDVIRAVEAVSGRRFERRSRGTAMDLAAQIGRLKADDPSSPTALGQTYLLFMIDGRTRLTDLQNARYPSIRPETYAEHVAAHWQGQ